MTFETKKEMGRKVRGWRGIARTGGKVRGSVGVRGRDEL